ncbi:glutamyl-tRNA reductase [Desulfoluna limicola]|uniref:Glutamyl-tRNA reductase n=2 Tax=Desulfoluna limicola TaxID=2810562 RepID=A0ABN6F9Z4_9BACT|nr:glutamyl-tRNA reductase [Desulfoluna limicola]
MSAWDERYGVMREIVLTGLNHKTAPVETRERLAFSASEAKEALGALRARPEIDEVMLLSSCNRVEVLMAARDCDAAVAASKAVVADFKGLPQADFESCLYTHHDNAAVRHMFRVAASLDSMVVGEPQILGQVKGAYHLAASEKASGPLLNRLMHRTFHVAKRVRSETGIGDSAVSISYAAIELARKIFGSLEGRKILLVGAGEMAELAVEHLIQHQAGDIFVANRTLERGVELARRFNGSAIALEELPEALKEVDIIISSTGSPTYVITRDMVKQGVKSRKGRSIFFIDIAVPRDIDPAINRLSNAYVYDIDDLKEVIDGNIESRNVEAVKAERIVEEGVVAFARWVEGLHTVPTIKAMRSKVGAIAECEVEKTLASLTGLSDEERAAIRRMGQAIVTKVVHDPIRFIKDGCHNRDESRALSYARSIFNLDE